MVGMVVSRLRPPWLETMRPSTPWSAQRAASSAVMMPLKTMGSRGEGAEPRDVVPRWRRGSTRLRLLMPALNLVSSFSGPPILASSARGWRW